jgi:hypothetical protein
MVYNYEKWDILWNCYIVISMVYCGQNLVDAKKTNKGFHLIHQTTQPNPILGCVHNFFYQHLASKLATILE